ncbi:hypothetical protein THAOC_27703, partial [Thalassiosira oceanica]
LTGASGSPRGEAGSGAPVDLSFLRFMRMWALWTRLIFAVFASSLPVSSPFSSFSFLFLFRGRPTPPGLLTLATTLQFPLDPRGPGTVRRPGREEGQPISRRCLSTDGAANSPLNYLDARASARKVTFPMHSIPPLGHRSSSAHSCARLRSIPLGHGSVSPSIPLRLRIVTTSTFTTVMPPGDSSPCLPPVRESPSVGRAQRLSDDIRWRWPGAVIPASGYMLPSRPPARPPPARCRE